MLFFDIETDGLLPDLTKIFTICIYDGKRYAHYDKIDVVNGLTRLATADTIIGHNIVGFDIPAIKKLYPQWETRAEIKDTLVYTRLLFPDIQETDYGLFNKGKLPGKLVGRHSLEAWGYRIRVFKGDYHKKPDAWATWTPEMSQYCEQDVRVTSRLWEYLQKRQPFPEQALELEHKTAAIIARQEMHGFKFNIEKAQELYRRLLQEKLKLSEKLAQLFPPFYWPVGKVVFEKDNFQASNVFIPKTNNAKLHYYAGGAMTKVELVDFNPGSSQHVAHWLIKKYNWKPEEFTEKTGEPKIDEDVLKTLPYQEAQEILNYMIIVKRLGQLAEGEQAWLKWVKDDGCIHGSINPCGAVTGRMTHYTPNMSQVPANYSPYGQECRELFEAREGYVLVGCDADGLEARCLAHYLHPFDNGEFANAVLHGSKENGTDIHTMNMKALRITSRDTAKTWFYAWMYGAGIAKQAKILGTTLTQAKKTNERFLRNMPGMARLRDAVQSTAKKRGYLFGLDGRRLHVRALHSALNTLLQSAGAVVMKQALVILDKDLQWCGFEYEFTANSHDEWQIETKPNIADEVGKKAVNAIKKAGEHFKFKCPLDGQYKIGQNWKETH